MTTHPGPGDTGRYPCPQCGHELRLVDTLDHIEQHLALAAEEPTNG